MRKLTLHAFVALLCFAGSGPAMAITDDFSTGPGQGAPDGLDDFWQAYYNGWGLSPTADDDHDGCSNLVECTAGSDPRNPGDCLAVGNMVFGVSNIVMNFDAKAGKMYQVWQSDSPGGALPGQPGSLWTEVAGASKLAAADGADFIAFPKPGGLSKFYRLESKDNDADNDGASDWAEKKLGTNANLANSPNNASGGAASDGDTLRSLMSLQATTDTADAFEKEGTAVTMRLKRSFGTMPLTVTLSGLPGTSNVTKSNASTGDFVIKNMANVTTSTVVLGSGQGLNTNVDVAKITPVVDTESEVPEALKVCVNLPGVPPTVPSPAVTVNIKDANPGDPANRSLFVAFLGREAGAASTASGYATALVDGDNNKASISVVFNNLSSDENTCYIRVSNDLEVLPLPLGQVSGAAWNIRAAQTEVTDQAMLDALKAGRVYVAITTVNFPDKEIFGYFNRANGSTTFDPNNDDLVAPALGSAVWQTPAGDALEREIYRFLSQCTFGPTTELYTQVRAEADAAISAGGTYIDGLRSWLNKQMDPAQTPTINFRTLVMAADNEEFMLRGNKPMSYNNDPQINGSTYGVSYTNGMPSVNTSANTQAGGNNYPQGGLNRRREWWTMVLQCKDQVRQRMAQALSEITVISENDQTCLDRHYGTANYWDMLAEGAFGKYRTLLEKVSMNPMMGVYLTSVANRATYEPTPGIVISPDENYAREIMQLFSIGLVLRHPDGSLVLNTDGLPIATYDQNDITELARVFTGFSHGARHGSVTAQTWSNSSYTLGNSTQTISPTVYFNGQNNHIWFGRQDGHLYWAAPWIYPMKVVGRISTSSTAGTVYHDFNPYGYPDPAETPPNPITVSKRLLAKKHGQYEISMATLPAFGVTNDPAVDAIAATEVKLAHDCLAGDAAQPSYGAGTQSSPGHQNTPVNISRWLIQRLITSNPSTGYIYRVQKVYRDTNGNLGEVLKAILLDYEARSLQLADTSISHGRVKEPMVAFASMLRTLHAYSGAPLSYLRDTPPPFTATDSPLPTAYPAGEFNKFSTDNVNPPSLPTGWGQGPFRFRFDNLTPNIGQSPQKAPNVFNWFMPDFTTPGRISRAGLVAPEMQIETESNEVSKINFFYAYTWMTLAGMSTTPGADSTVSDFILSNAMATPAVRFSLNGGTSFTNTVTFNETNWDQPQTISVSAINNLRYSTLANNTVRFSVTSLSTTPTYSGIAVQPKALSIVENEQPSEYLIVEQTGNETWVTEGGATDTINVRLSAPPMATIPVQVTLAATTGQVSLSAMPLVFDSNNWNVPQSVTVTAMNDLDTEVQGAGDDLITITSTSAAANFNGLTAASVAAHVVDNDDSFGVLVTKVGGTLNVVETTSTSGASTDNYTLVLTKAPTSNVTITCTPGNAQIALNSSGTTFATQGVAVTRTFTPANWATAQTVVARGYQDTTSENNHTSSIAHTITLASPEYPTTMPLQGLAVNVTDDDNSIIVSHTGGETRVSEDGRVTDTINVVLRVVPNNVVTVNLSSSQLRFTPSELTFTPAGGSAPYNVVQQVTVSAVDDWINEGVHTTPINVLSQSIGTNYNGSTAGVALTATIIDDDDARLVATQSGGTTVVGEDGTTDSYTLVLTRQPKPGTTVTVTAGGYSQIALTPAGPFVFDETNWNLPQTVQVSALSDTTVETRATVAITNTMTSGDPTYNGGPAVVVTPFVEDNEVPLTVAQSNGITTVKEGGTTGTGGTPNVQDTFTVLLPRAPSAGTTVTVNLSTNGQVTVSPSVLTFTSAATGTGSYTVAQTVTVSAVADTLPEPTPHSGVISFGITSTDSYYNGITQPPVFVQVTDNSTAGATTAPGVSIVESSGITGVTEGSTTDTFTVVLTKQPTAAVDVVVTGGPQCNVNKSGGTAAATATLNFTTANWNTAQTVTVTAINDTVAELRHLGVITSAVSPTSAAEYQGVSIAPVTAIISDNDNTVAANKVLITESSSSTSTNESGTTDSFTILLSQAPTAPVLITLTPNSQVACTPSVLTFTAANWSTAQTVTVRAVDDSLIEPLLHWGTIAATAASTDPVYDGIAIATVNVSIGDNDGPRVIMTQDGGTTVLGEGGDTDNFSLVLSREPTADVTVTIDPGTQVSVPSTTVTFTPTGGATPWNVPQTITMTAVDDATPEGTHTTVINQSVASADPLYNGIAIPTITATIWDNDGAALIVNHAGTDPTSTMLVEGGSGDTMTIRLASPPAAGTTVDITLIPPTYLIPVPPYAKQFGYFANDFGTNNQKDRIVIDYTEVIQLYRSTFYGKLAAEYGGTIPNPFPATPAAADNIKLQNSHWAASKAIIDKMDLWWGMGALKARNPVLIEPNQPLPSPLPGPNPRQAILDAIYRINGGAGSPGTTRYAVEVVYNPKSPPTGTFADEVRDRCRWAGYLMTVAAPGLVAH